MSALYWSFNAHKLQHHKHKIKSICSLDRVLRLSQNPNSKNCEHLDSKHGQNLRIKTIDDRSQY